MRWLSPPDSVPEARRQGEIVEADVDEEVQPVADFLQDAGGDFVLLLGEACSADLSNQMLAARIDSLRDLADVLAADLDRQRLRFQPVAVAGLARVRGLVAGEFLAHPFAVGLAPAAVDVADDALERLVGLVVARAVVSR